MEVQMIKGKGPVFPEPLAGPDDLKRLLVDVDVTEALKYVYEAITLTRKTLDGKVPLIGFAGAPWTLMVYMIEGGSSKTYSKAKRWLYMHPDASTRLLQILTKIIIEYLVEQVKAGAQLLQVFDSHAGELTEQMFHQYCLPYLKEIATKVKNCFGPEHAVPMIVFAKGAHYSFSDLNQTDYDVVALDWTINCKQARVSLPNKTLMGNLDPCAMYSNVDDLDTHVEKMIHEFGTTKYIANLGHGMYPDMDPDHMEAFVNAIHKHSTNYINGKS